MRFVRAFFEAGKPVAAICHGPWTLIEAGRGARATVTTWPSHPDGPDERRGEWVDEEVVADQGLVTSRKPDDIPQFNAKMIEEFAEGIHEVAAGRGGGVAAGRGGADGVRVGGGSEQKPGRGRPAGGTARSALRPASA